MDVRRTIHIAPPYETCRRLRRRDVKEALVNSQSQIS